MTCVRPIFDARWSGVSPGGVNRGVGRGGERTCVTTTEVSGHSVCVRVSLCGPSRTVHIACVDVRPGGVQALHSLQVPIDSGEMKGRHLLLVTGEESRGQG